MCIPACSCGTASASLKIFLQHQHEECAMEIFMGFYDKYSHVRGQILLMDPLPMISKVFALVLQEEQQQDISSSSLYPMSEYSAIINNLSQLLSALATSQNFNKQHFPQKDRPICRHCGKTRHVIDKCFQLHGFPPRYRSNKPKQSSFSTNQISEVSGSSSKPSSDLSVTHNQVQNCFNYLNHN